MKTNKILFQIIYINIILVLLLFPKTILADGYAVSKSDPDNYDSVCKSYLGISITASAYDRNTSISSNNVTSRTISMACKGRCRAHIYYAPYGNLDLLGSESIGEDDADIEDLVSTKKHTFNDSYTWSLPAGYEALIIVVSLNERECAKKDKDSGACIEYKYPKKETDTKYCAGYNDKGKCIDKKPIKCNKGNFNSDDILEEGISQVEITGNGASLFVQNPKESGLVSNIRSRYNSDYGEACNNAYNGIYDGSSTKYNVKKEDLEEYRNNYYRKVLDYCEQKDVPFNLKPSQIKKISNSLLRVFYSRKQQEKESSKTLDYINKTIDRYKNTIEKSHIYNDTSKLNPKLNCDFSKTSSEYLYTSKTKTVKAELSSGSVKVCKIRCYEHLTVKYDPPATVKAGLCFQYKVTVKSESECGMEDDFDLSKVTVQNMCSPSPICSNTTSHTQAGPNENFDSCVQDCDNGQYSQACINSCYKKVYSSKTSTTKTSSKINENVTVNKGISYLNKQPNGIVKKLADDETEYKNYQNEDNNKNCNTNSIISYVNNNNQTKLSECAEYFFNAKAMYPKGSYNKNRTKWVHSSDVNNDGATNKGTSNIPMQIARSSPFYLRSIEETKSLLIALVGYTDNVYKKYNISSEGFKRQYSTRYVCNEVCSFTGCKSSDICTNNEFSNVTAKDLQALEDALNECQVSTSCKSEPTETEFTIDISANNDGKNENASQKGTTSLDSVYGYGDIDEDGDGNADMFIPENGTSNSNTGILGLCYDKRPTPQYQTTITYPGTYINYKSAKRVYTKTYDDSYYYKKGYFCTPYGLEDVNEKYWWATVNNDNAYLANFTPTYNINATLGSDTKSFGKYNWKINFNCFYSAYHELTPPSNPPSAPPTNPPNNPPPGGGDDECNSENSTRYCNVRFRVVDSNTLFPDKNGKPISDESNLPFNWTNRAKDLAAQNNSTLQSRGYALNPGEYKQTLEQRNPNSVFNGPASSAAYHIKINKNNINEIKNYTRNYGYNSYQGSYTKVDGVDGFYYYQSNLLDNSTYVESISRNTRLGYNNN